MFVSYAAVPADGSAYLHVGASGDFTASGVAQIVPEPGLALVSALGLLALARARRPRARPPAA